MWLRWSNQGNARREASELCLGVASQKPFGGPQQHLAAAFCQETGTLPFAHEAAHGEGRYAGCMRQLLVGHRELDTASGLPAGPAA